MFIRKQNCSQSYLVRHNFLTWDSGRHPLLGLLLLTILTVGTCLRFHALDRQSLWDDEMSTLRTVTTPAHEVLRRFATYETHPPLYFAQLKLWRALHLRSLVKLRANSAFWGSVSLLLAYCVGRLYGGETLGLLTAAFLALSPFHLAYSQELRSYAMAIAISLASLWALETSFRRKPALHTSGGPGRRLCGDPESSPSVRCSGPRLSSG